MEKETQAKSGNDSTDNVAKECCRCKHFDRYYTKEPRHFKGIGLGRCCKRGEDVGIHFVCDKFCLRTRKRGFSHLIKHRLSEILDELSEIRKLLETESDDGENKDL